MKAEVIVAPDAGVLVLDTGNLILFADGVDPTPFFWALGVIGTSDTTLMVDVDAVGLELWGIWRVSDAPWRSISLTASGTWALFANLRTTSSRRQSLEPTNGYAGRLLRVDLTTRKSTSEELEPATLRKYVGGMALGAKYLYDEVRPGTKWSDPENQIMMFSGPHGATKAMGTGTFCLVTIGAMTEGSTSSQANGFFGAFLKLCGFDGLIIKGKAPKLSYLYIHDGGAEIRECPHLAGASTWDTEDLIKKELGYESHNMSVFGMGPAGEKMVRFAVMMGDRCHTPGHNGTGAVLGSKNLKAIAVARGKGKITVADDATITAANKEHLAGMQQGPLFKHGTLWIMARNAPIMRAPILNESVDYYPMTDEQLNTFSPEYLIEHLAQRRHSCWACPVHHAQIIKIWDGPLAGKEAKMPEYEGFAALGTNLGIYEGLPVSSLCAENDYLGMDVNEMGWLLGMLMEAYQKGVITAKDLDGVEMKWGSIEAVRTMLYKIAHREGCGDWLAEGVMRAAAHIGGEAPQFAIHTMSGTTPRSHDHRRTWSYVVDNSTSQTGSSEANVTVDPVMFGHPALEDPYDGKQVARMVGRIKGIGPFHDSLGGCQFNIPQDPKQMMRLFNAVTGWDMTWDEALDVGLRSITLMRAHNILSGYDIAKDAPSPRYGGVPTAGLGEGKDIRAQWKDTIEEYYDHMGWDRATGKPTPETLKRLGLDFVIPDLWPS